MSRLAGAAHAARQLAWALRPRAEENGFREIRSRFYRGFWQQAARAVGAELVALDGDFWQARRGNAWTLIRQDQIALDDHLRVRLARNKAVTARLLAPYGFAAPASVEFDLASLDKAKAFLAAARGPIVVKPDGIPRGRFVSSDGPGAGRGITCGIRSPAELARAARWGALFGARLIAEEEIEGASYRLLYLDGRLIDAVRRDPPRVFGDGTSTLAQLIRAENAERRLARPPLAFSPLTVDLDCRLTLARQGLTLASRPRAQAAVQVKTVCNQNAAYDNHVVLDRIHPRLASLGGDLAWRLGLRLAGVDIMSTDPAAPPAQGRFAVNEVNANPGLHHHWLVAEPERRTPVGALALEAALCRKDH